MSKAILVVDTPSKCSECKIQDMCLKNKCCIPFYKRDEECPLKEMPPYKEFTDYDEYFDEGFKSGYNTCLDEILGGGE